MVNKKPYTLFAKYYDEIMDHVEYDRWARYIRRLIRHYRLPAETLVDLGGGTASLALELGTLGFACDVMDGSRSMLNRARKKIGKKAIRLYCRDLRDFRLPRKYPLALCLHDTINYLHTLKDLKAMFRSVAENLEDEGHFIFDNCTDYNVEVNFANQTFMESKEDFSYIWKNGYSKGKHQASAWVEIVERRRPGTVCLETHVQKLHSDAIILKASAAQFVCLDILDGFHLRPPHPHSEEKYYLMRKKP